LNKLGDKRTAATTTSAPADAASAPPGEVTGQFPKYVSVLRNKAGVEFSGRILELGAGAAWFTAELSKLPKVVEVIATDFAGGPAQEQAPQVFKALRAHEAKIIRRAASAHRLNFRDGYFDFVVCNAVLHEAMNLLQLLREVRRVLKPGGQLVAVREPVKPFVRWRAGRGEVAGRASRRLQSPLYSRADYEDVFERAGFSVKIRRVSLASGLKYYFDTVVNGLTHARYVFVATRNEKAGRDRPKTLPA
jgi:SAM-dependent methyltransferase